MRCPTPFAVATAAAAVLPYELLARIAVHHVSIHSKWVASNAFRSAVMWAPRLFTHIKFEQYSNMVYIIVCVDRECGAQATTGWILLKANMYDRRNPRLNDPACWTVVRQLNMANMLTPSKASRSARFHLTAISTIQGRPTGSRAGTTVLHGGGSVDSVTAWVNAAAAGVCASGCA